MAITYIDMDGVLAQFEQAPYALQRFESEPKFFETLKPTKYATRLRLKGVKENTYILTSSPHERADKAKRAWIARYLPELKDKVICVRSGQEKANYANGNVLIDDYTDNLEHWVAKGGKAIKALNGLNGKTFRYKKVAFDSVWVD